MGLNHPEIIPLTTTSVCAKIIFPKTSSWCKNAEAAALKDVEIENHGPFLL